MTQKSVTRWVMALGVLVLAAGTWFGVSRLGTRQAALDQNLILITPFRVSGGGPEIAVLREGMLDLMATYLTGEGGTLRAADPSTVVAAWRRRVGSETDDLSEDEARALARELGAGRLLTGSILASGGQLVIRGALSRLDDGGPALQASVDGNARALRQHLAHEARQQCHEAVRASVD